MWLDDHPIGALFVLLCAAAAVRLSIFRATEGAGVISSLLQIGRRLYRALCRRRLRLLLSLLLAMIIFERHLVLGGPSKIYVLRKHFWAWQQAAYAQALVARQQAAITRASAASHAHSAHSRSICELVDAHARIPRRVYRAFNPHDRAQAWSAAASRHSWTRAGFDVIDYDDNATLDTWFNTRFPLRHEYAHVWRVLGALPVQRIDFFRIAILWTEGGWWADADVDLQVCLPQSAIQTTCVDNRP